MARYFSVRVYHSYVDDYTVLADTPEEAEDLVGNYDGDVEGVITLVTNREYVDIEDVMVDEVEPTTGHFRMEEA